MPYIQYFIPCEKVIKSEDEANDISIIGVIDSLTFERPSSDKSTGLRGVPFVWFTIAQWVFLPEDRGKNFEQRVNLILPNKKSNGSSIIPFYTQGVAHKSRNVTRAEMFPVMEDGIYTFRIQFREIIEGDEQKWKTAYSYPIEVTIEPASEDIEATLGVT